MARSAWSRIGGAGGLVLVVALLMPAAGASAQASEGLSDNAKLRKDMRAVELEEARAAERERRKPRIPLSRKNLQKLAEDAESCRVFHPQRCESLATIGAWGAEAGPALTKLLDSKIAVHRAAAALMIGHIGYRASAGRIVPLFDDGDRRVRLAALTAAGRLQPEGAVAALGARLGVEDFDEKLTAAVALGQTRSPGALGPLLTLLRHQHPKLRATAARSLGSVGDNRATMPVATLLADPRSPPNVRKAACESLGRLKDDRAVPMLLLMVGDSDAGVRAAAIHSLGRLKDARAVPLLSLAAKEQTLTRPAVEALGAIGHSDGLPALIRVLEERRDDERTIEKAFLAIGVTGSKTALPALVPYLKDDDTRFVVWAADAIGRIGERSAAEPLLEALRRDDQDVKDMVAWALQQVTGQRLGDDVDAWEAWLFPPQE